MANRDEYSVMNTLLHRTIVKTPELLFAPAVNANDVELLACMVISRAAYPDPTAAVEEMLLLSTPTQYAVHSIRDMKAYHLIEHLFQGVFQGLWLLLPRNVEGVRMCENIMSYGSFQLQAIR